MLSLPATSSVWRATIQALQQNFRLAAEAYPNLGHAILQALDEEGTLPRSLEDAMSKSGGWSVGEIRSRWEVPAGQWMEGDAQAFYLTWWHRNCPPKLGYLYGDPTGRKRFEYLAERAWLALPGTPGGKAQAYPQPRPLERWMAFVYRQVASAPSPYLAAEEELWVTDHTEDGHIVEQRFPPRAVEQGSIVSTGYPDAAGQSSRARRWIYTALATDPFTVSAVAIDLLLADPDPEGPRLVSWEEMDAFQKSPAFQNANFLIDFIILANGNRFPVYRRDCKPVPGAKPSICPSAEPKPPVRLRPVGEMMLDLEKCFRRLRLVGDGETIHWVGRQATVETTCICDLSNPLEGDENKDDEGGGKMLNRGGLEPANQTSYGSIEAPVSLTHKADKQTLGNIEQEIDRWLFSHVKRWRCVEPASLVGVVLEPMKDDEVRAFLAAHYRELWEKVLPERLKRQHAEVQARLGTESVQVPLISKDRLHVEVVDNFAKVRDVEPSLVAQFLNDGYLDQPEDAIQMALESILGVSFHKKDWGGESNDLYTANLLVNGARTPTAFMLKGNGLKSRTMEVKHCGKNGDQVIRLFQSPAGLFVIQFVGNISEAVIQHAHGEVARLKTQGKETHFLIMDGQDTARLMHAYGKL